MNSLAKNRISRAGFPSGLTARAVVAVTLAGVLSAACDVHGISEPGTVMSISVTPNATIAATSTQQMVAVGHDADGRVVAITPTWSVAASGGSISTAGVFTAGTVVGSFPNTVVASVGSVSGRASITVTAGALASIEVTPGPVSLAIATSQAFVAVGRDAGGNIVPFTPSWSVVAGGGAIDQAGMFTANGTVGTYINTVQASQNGITAFATVTVTSGPLASITLSPSPATLTPNGTQQFTALGADAAGNPVAISPTWDVVASGGIVGSSGMFTAGALSGTFANTVRASSGGRTGVATVIVTNGAAASITVTPSAVTMAIGATQMFTAVGTDAQGNTFVVSPVWSIMNGGGNVDAGTGLFTAGASAGTFTATVNATSGLLSGTATVTVTTVAVPPPAVNLGAAALNGIMSGTAVTCVSGGTINANASISPGNTITGFGPCVVTGVQNLGNAIAAQGQLDLTVAYNTLAGMACPPANAIVANLGGTTKPAGVYCTASGIGVTGVLTLDGGGDPNAVFVFQAGTSLTTAGSVVLINSAQAKNVYWQVGSSATLGTGSAWQGNILALTSITLVDNATLSGRALARNGAVTLGTNNVIILP